MHAVIKRHRVEGERVVVSDHHQRVGEPVSKMTGEQTPEQSRRMYPAALHSQQGRNTWEI